MMARWHYWLLQHPRIGRPLTVYAIIMFLSLTATRLAPVASASWGGWLVDWMGFRDTFGVSPGDYFLGMASISDQLTKAGPEVTWNPGTWVEWMGHLADVAFVNTSGASILSAEIGAFVGIFTVSLWVMRISVSAYWLLLFGDIARNVTDAVITVTTRWGLVGITTPIGVFLGAMAVRRGEHGRGWTMILVAIAMPLLVVTVFRDPAGLMYGPHGLLQFGRSAAFNTAQAATHNGPIGPGGFNAQIDTLTASLITHGLREPLEMFNFGHVVDKVGNCAGAYSEAMRSHLGHLTAPVDAMKQCGDMAAVHYAQQLNGANVFTGLVLVLVALLFGWFMISSGWAVMQVSLKAIYTTAKLIPSLYAGGISGAAQEHAKSTVWKFFKHPIEVTVLITFVSVMGLAVERMITAPLPSGLGGTSPAAHILMLGATSAAALFLLRHIKADLSGHAPGRGVLGRAGDVALGLAMHAGLGAAGKAALGGAKGLRGSLRQTPWEKIENQTDKPQEVLGDPQEGFDPTGNEVGATVAPSGAPDSPEAAGGSAAGGAGGSAGGGAAGGAAQAINSPANVDPVTRMAGAATQAVGNGQSERRARRAQQPAALDGRQQGFDAADGTGVGGTTWRNEAPQVDPVSHGVSTGVGEDIPLPDEPPFDDDHGAPPPDDYGHQGATVEPITDR